jgi:D-glycero-alpha-D-manno-heptose-7-phosphate kinase
MILTRAPFRLPLGGGATDLPEYYKQYEGELVTATINHYVYVFINKPILSDKIKLYHHAKESLRVEDINLIEHAIIRESFKLHNVNFPIEAGSTMEIEEGTGLGSSSVFAVALLTGLNTLQHKFVSPEQIAEEASYVEIDLIGKPIGKQDQYAAAIGGINKLHINRRGIVTVQPLKIDPETILELENRLLLFYTGNTRNANEILAEQSQKIKEKICVDYMHEIKAIGIEIEKALLKGDITMFGKLLHQHWNVKKRISDKMSTIRLDEIYNTALKSGAIGGKILGAGGSGFFMFCVKDHDRKQLKKAMEKYGLKFMDFRFEFEGVKVLTNI